MKRRLPTHALANALGIATTALVAGAGCVEEGTPPLGSPLHTSVRTAELTHHTVKKIDLLLVIDDSSSMVEEQANLAANLGVFVDLLEAPGVDADYRITVTTTDVGHGSCAPSGVPPGAFQTSSCLTRPEDFVDAQHAPDAELFAASCLSACAGAGLHFTLDDVRPTTTQHDPVPRPRPWIEGNTRGTNLPPGISASQALACLGAVGTAGCDVEAPLEAMLQALSRAKLQGSAEFDFLRDDAVLVILVITDEVDCSFSPAWEDEVFSLALPEDNRLFWEDPSGLPTSAICWNAGVSCAGDGAGYDSCEPADRGLGSPTQLPVDNDPLAGDPWPTAVIDDVMEADRDAVLFPVKRYVEFLSGLEREKQATDHTQQVVLGFITGVPLDYPVTPSGDIPYRDAEDTATQAEYGVDFGCTSSVGQATPPVRLRAVGEAFALDGERNLFSICANDFSPALDPVVQSLPIGIRPACFPGCVADTDPNTVSVEPACRVFQRAPGQSRVEVPRCAGTSLPAGQAACFYTLDETAAAFALECSDGGSNLEFVLRRDPNTDVPDETRVTAECLMAADVMGECPNLRF